MKRPTWIATCHVPGCDWHLEPQVVRVAVDDAARYHRQRHRREAAS